MRPLLAWWATLTSTDRIVLVGGMLAELLTSIL